MKLDNHKLWRRSLLNIFFMCSVSELSERDPILPPGPAHYEVASIFGKSLLDLNIASFVARETPSSRIV